MAHSNQGGSILSFVVVALLLAALLIGGAYAVRRFTTQPEQQTPSTSQNQPAPHNAAQQNKAADNNSQAPVKVSPQVNNDSSVASQLPQTGTSSLLGSVVALALLSGVAVSYVRSRRPELSL
jgi:LPXTG-motif cell wall-anchored protein